MTHLLANLGRFISIWALVLMTACQKAGESRAPAIAVRDSAGVELLGANFESVIDGGAHGRQVRWLTFSDGPVYRVYAGTFLESGSFVLAHSNYRLSAFREAGQELFSIGSEGKGPGEYGRISAISALHGDSIGVLHDLRFVTVLDHRGDFGRRYILPTAFNPGTREDGLMRTGEIFLLQHVPPIAEIATGGGGLVTGTSLVLRLQPPYTTPDTILRLPGTTWNVVGRGSATAAPFGASTLLAVGDSSVVVGWTGANKLYELDASGRLRRIITISLSLDRVSGEEIGRWCRAHYPEQVDCRILLTELGRRAERRFPEYKPVFSSIAMSKDGELWVQKYFDPSSSVGPQTWYVFSPDRRGIHQVSLPPPLRVAAVDRGGRLLVVHVDSLGVERVGVVVPEP